MPIGTYTVDYKSSLIISMRDLKSVEPHLLASYTILQSLTYELTIWYPTQ